MNTCGLNISADARERHVLGMRSENLRAHEGQSFVIGLFSDNCYRYVIRDEFT